MRREGGGGMNGNPLVRIFFLLRYSEINLHWSKIRNKHHGPRTKVFTINLHWLNSPELGLSSLPFPWSWRQLTILHPPSWISLCFFNKSRNNGINTKSGQNACEVTSSLIEWVFLIEWVYSWISAIWWRKLEKYWLISKRLVFRQTYRQTDRQTDRQVYLESYTRSSISTISK